MRTQSAWLCYRATDLYLTPCLPFIGHCSKPLIPMAGRMCCANYTLAYLTNDQSSTLKKKFRTHVIKLEIAPMSYPPGQYLLVSASNNMLYYLSQWDKIRTTCVVNLMSQDTKFWLFKINWDRIRTHNLQDNTLILYQCATFTLFKFVQIGYINS